MYGQRHAISYIPQRSQWVENKVSAVVDLRTNNRYCIWPDIGLCSLLMYAAYKIEV